MTQEQHYVSILRKRSSAILDTLNNKTKQQKNSDCSSDYRDHAREEVGGFNGQSSINKPEADPDLGLHCKASLKRTRRL